MSDFTTKANDFIQDVTALNTFVNGDTGTVVTLPNGQTVSSMRKLANDTVNYLNAPGNHYTKLEANDHTLNTIDAVKLNGKQYSQIVGVGSKNRIINGDFNVNQRGQASYVFASDAATNTFSGGYTLDRVKTANSKAGGQFTVTQGELNGHKTWKCTVDTPPTNLTWDGTADRYWHGILYFFEGQHLYDLAVNQENVTISFVFNSNVSGIYSTSFRLEGGTLDSYVSEFTYTAGSPQKVSVTIPLNHTWYKTLTNDNNRGFSVVIGFIGGNHKTPSLNQWVSGNYVCSPNYTNWGAAAGNFIEIAQLQLEKGTEATDFEYVPYDIQLMRCMRYYEIVASNQYNGTTIRWQGHPTSHSGSARWLNLPFKYEKRTAPAITVIGLGMLYSSSGNVANTAIGSSGTFSDIGGVGISVVDNGAVIPKTSVAHFDLKVGSAIIASAEL